MKFTLSETRLSKLSDIASETGVVMFASVALPAVLGKFDIVNATIGLASTIFLTIFRGFLVFRS